LKGLRVPAKPRWSAPRPDSQTDFKRIQFTPDLMPGDVLGTHILQETSSGKRELAFQPGPVFTKHPARDEINTGLAQDPIAMLETMQELRDAARTTRPCPAFFVLAARTRSSWREPIACPKRTGPFPVPAVGSSRWMPTCWTHHLGAAARRIAGTDLADGT